MPWRITPALRAQVSASLLHAEYLDTFDTCVAAPCPAPPAASPNRRTVQAGNRIAGTQRALAWGELAWKPGAVPGEFAVEVQGRAATAANDLNDVYAPGFGVINLRWSASWGQTSRLLIGPFASFTRAKAVEADLKKAGADAFAWQSDAGEVVEKLGSK